MSSAAVIGLSHSAAIAEALQQDDKNAGRVSVHRLDSKNKARDRDTISVEKAIEVAASVPSDGAVFLALLGTIHNVLGLLKSGPEFDLLVNPGDVADGNTTTLVPNRALSMAIELNRARGPTIEKIAAASVAPVYLLSSPPPKQSNDYIRDRLMPKSHRLHYGKSIQDVGIERPETRLKLWALETHLSAAWAVSKGIEFLPAPDKCFNRERFLSRKYYHDDATHANARYGALVVEQIIGILDSMRDKAAHG